jgi:hypothetical protein
MVLLGQQQRWRLGYFRLPSQAELGLGGAVPPDEEHHAGPWHVATFIDLIMRRWLPLTGSLSLGQAHRTVPSWEGGDVPGLSSGGIFLSYRRQDAAPYARLLQQQLGQRFPDVRVFMDLDSIEPGLPFVKVIQQALDSCTVLVALIGRQWATLTDEEGIRRLDDPDDYVRFEVKTALERGVRVIPVLVDEARPLRQQQLPSELHQLAQLNALELSYGRYDYDAGRLFDLLQRVLAASRDQAEPEGKAQAEAGRKAEEQAEGKARQSSGLKALDALESGAIAYPKVSPQHAYRNFPTPDQLDNAKDLIHLRGKDLMAFAYACAVQHDHDIAYWRELGNKAPRKAAYYLTSIIESGHRRAGYRAKQELDRLPLTAVEAGRAESRRRAEQRQARQESLAAVKSRIASFGRTWENRLPRNTELLGHNPELLDDALSHLEELDQEELVLLFAIAVYNRKLEAAIKILNESASLPIMGILVELVVGDVAGPAWRAACLLSTMSDDIIAQISSALPTAVPIENQELLQAACEHRVKELFSAGRGPGIDDPDRARRIERDLKELLSIAQIGHPPRK